jgi:hypothetical protein
MDCVLKRILKEWAGDVEDDYRDIATECLRFQQLSKKFYDPSLTQGAQQCTGTFTLHSTDSLQGNFELSLSSLVVFQNPFGATRSQVLTWDGPLAALHWFYSTAMKRRRLAPSE